LQFGDEGHRKGIVFINWGARDRKPSITVLCSFLEMSDQAAGLLVRVTPVLAAQSRRWIYCAAAFACKAEIYYPPSMFPHIAEERQVEQP